MAEQSFPPRNPPCRQDRLAKEEAARREEDTVGLRMLIDQWVTGWGHIGPIYTHIYNQGIYTAYLFFVCVHIFVYLEYTRRHLLAYACTFGIWIWKHLRLIYMLPSPTRQHHLHNCTPTGCNQQRHAAHRHTICGGILPYALYLATGSPEEASGTWAP